MTLSFTKYHGLGNDFVVVDLRHTDAAIASAIQAPATVAAMFKTLTPARRLRRHA